MSDTALEEYQNGASAGFPRTYDINGQTYTAYNAQEGQRLAIMQQDAIKQANVIAGTPQRPTFESILGPDGIIQDQYQIGSYADQLMSDDKGFHKFQEEALRDGPSQYANLMLEQQGLERTDRLDDINSQYNMGLQTSMDQLASQGGLRSGAGERMGANSIRDMLNSRQGARSDFQKQKLGILGEDEGRRLNQLQSLTGMEADRNQTKLQAKEFDLQNSFSERQSQRQDGMDAWKTQMETWASNKQADAQKNAGGCFPAGTLIELPEGGAKKIEEISVGEEVFGGTVTKVIQGLAFGAKWFDYDGVTVTADHAVLEDGVFIRVKDSKIAKPIDFKTDKLYNLSTAGHLLLIGERMFSDFDEVDDVTLSYEESLKEKNRKSCLKRIS